MTGQNRSTWRGIRDFLCRRNAHEDRSFAGILGVLHGDHAPIAVILMLLPYVRTPCANRPFATFLLCTPSLPHRTRRNDHVARAHTSHSSSTWSSPLPWVSRPPAAHIVRCVTSRLYSGFVLAPNHSDSWQCSARHSWTPASCAKCRRTAHDSLLHSTA